MLQTLIETITGTANWLLDFVVAFARRRPFETFLILLALARMFGTTVRTGQAGVLFRFGRARKVLEPGFHPLIPIVQKVRKVPVRSITLNLPRQRVTSADGLVFDVDATLVFHISDPVKALVEVDDLLRACINVVALVVHDAMREQTREGLTDRSAVDAEINQRAQKALARWGVTIEQAGLNTIAPTRTTTRLSQQALRVAERAAVLRSAQPQAADEPAGESGWWGRLPLLPGAHIPVSHAHARYHARRRRKKRPAPVTPKT